MARKSTSGDRQDELSPVPDATSATEERTKTWIHAIQDRDDDELKAAVEARLKTILARFNLENYLVLLLFDDCRSIASQHADQLYAAASALLILQSPGGSIEPAYLLSKTLKRLSAKRFVVAVPRRAKSAATLISLGADEIHMGMMSQLGPIDPQIGGLPALALGNALNVVAELACRYPDASEMLTKFLSQQTSMRVLGYFQRVSESAVQYAERLLAGKDLNGSMTAEAVSGHLVNHYKDHGFVIDLEEATKLLGSNMIREGTPEYKAADAVYSFLDLVNVIWAFTAGNATTWEPLKEASLCRTSLQRVPTKSRSTSPLPESTPPLLRSRPGPLAGQP